MKRAPRKRRPARLYAVINVKTGLPTEYLGRRAYPKREAQALARDYRRMGYRVRLRAWAPSI